MKLYQLFFYVPESDLEKAKDAIFAAGAGRVGNYSQCAWQVLGEGQFYPQVGSAPYIGQLNKIEKIAEYKVETVCAEQYLTAVIAALLAAHPYETPAYGLVELKNATLPN